MPVAQLSTQFFGFDFSLEQSFQFNLCQWLQEAVVLAGLNVLINEIVHIREEYVIRFFAGGFSKYLSSREEGKLNVQKDHIGFIPEHTLVGFFVTPINPQRFEIITEVFEPPLDQSNCIVIAFDDVICDRSGLHGL